MEIFIYVILILILIVVVALVIALNSFSNNVKQLFGSDKISNQLFHHKQLEGLPAPVQHYFRHVLKDGQPYINHVRLRHHGRFKTAIDGKWKPITGEEYFTANSPGFVWRGKLKKMTAIDSFISGEGQLKVYLFSMIRIVRDTGSKFSQGELLRWLGESAWFPTTLLPNDRLSWEPINDHQSKLVYRYEKLSVSYIATFSEEYEIIKLETKRFMGNGALESWTGKLSNYKLFNNVLIPTTMRATWNLEQGDFTYAVFYLNHLEYNVPEKF